MERKIIYNPNSKESLNDRRVFGGNSDGMINFTKMKYQWALNLWDTMEANTWFPREVQMTQDAKDYKYLTPAEKRMYGVSLLTTSTLHTSIFYIIFCFWTLTS